MVKLDPLRVMVIEFGVGGWGGALRLRKSICSKI